jgi:hypothetical protein
MIILFSLLGILLFIEASTSIARYSAIERLNLSSGLILQNALSIFSRSVMAFFMPILGYMADENNLIYFNLEIIITCLLILVTSLYIPIIFFNKINEYYGYLLDNIISSGSFFKKIEKIEKIEKTQTKKKKQTKFLLSLKIITTLAYIPFYISWPLTIMMISIYNDNRAFILGLTSILNGINTIVITLYIDPKLIYLSKYKNIAKNIYWSQLNIRLSSLIVACTILLFIYYYNF